MSSTFKPPACGWLYVGVSYTPSHTNLLTNIYIVSSSTRFRSGVPPPTSHERAEGYYLGLVITSNYVYSFLIVLGRHGPSWAQVSSFRRFWRVAVRTLAHIHRLLTNINDLVSSTPSSALERSHQRWAAWGLLGPVIDFSATFTHASSFLADTVSSRGYCLIA